MSLAIALLSFGYLLLATPQQFGHYWALCTDPVMRRMTRKCWCKWDVIGYSVEVGLWVLAAYGALTHRGV